MLMNPFSITAIVDAIEILTGEKNQSPNSIPSSINKIVGKHFLDSFKGRSYTHKEEIALVVIYNTFKRNNSIVNLGTELISDKMHTVGLSQLIPKGKSELTLLKIVLSLKIAKPELEFNVLKKSYGYAISLSGGKSMESLRSSCIILLEHPLNVEEGTYLGQPALITPIIADKLTS